MPSAPPVPRPIRPTPTPCSATLSSRPTTPKRPSPPGNALSSCVPTPTVEQFLAKAQREQTVESDFAQGESSHFVLHYEGKQTSEALRGQILAALESDYDDLARDLGNPPRDNILVTLYTEQAFFDVTHAPTWSGRDQ